MQAAPNRLQKAKIGPAAPNSDTLVDAAVTAYPIHIEYEEEWWQHTPLSESKTHYSFDTDTKFWAGMRWLDGQLQAAVNTVLPQHSPKLLTNDAKPGRGVLLSSGVLIVLSQPCYDLFDEDILAKQLYEHKKGGKYNWSWSRSTWDVLSRPWVDLYVHDNTTVSFIWKGVGIAHASPSSAVVDMGQCSSLPLPVLIKSKVVKEALQVSPMLRVQVQSCVNQTSKRL